MRAADARRLARDRVHDPVFWADVLQAVKTVVAAVIAWVLATRVFHLPQSFLAPWAALLVVHATVYRTFSEGARQVGAAVLGVLVAWVVGNSLALDPVSVAVAMTAGLALGAVPWLSGQGTTVAATAVIVLSTGFANNDNVLVSRLADTAIGIVTGLAGQLRVLAPAAGADRHRGDGRPRRRDRRAARGHGGRPRSGLHRRGRAGLGRPDP